MSDRRQPSPGVCGFYGKVNGARQEGPFPACCCQCLCPCGVPLLTHASTGDPPTSSCSCGSVSCGVTAPLLWVLVHARFCLCPPRLEFLFPSVPPRLESLFPPVLWKSCNQIPMVFKARFPWGSQSLCQVPRLGSLMCGSEPLQLFFGIIVSPVCGSPTRRVSELILS